jgi:hypothetical protein
MLEKVVSGGQSGVDRAALDVALEMGIPCGGWCPKGRRAEDGVIDVRYPLEETASPHYRVRTEKNVRGSVGTLIITWGRTKGGTALTIRLAEKYKKPLFVVDLASGCCPYAVKEWIQKNNIKILNVAGPRESESPGIHLRAVQILRTILT